jgi:hypothetical protein
VKGANNKSERSLENVPHQTAGAIIDNFEAG